MCANQGLPIIEAAGSLGVQLEARSVMRGQRVTP